MQGQIVEHFFAWRSLHTGNAGYASRRRVAAHAHGRNWHRAHQTPQRNKAVRCYGASGDEIASIGKLLTDRWLHRRRCNLANGAIRDAQAEEAAKAAQRPEPFAYTVRS